MAFGKPRKNEETLILKLDKEDPTNYEINQNVKDTICRQMSKNEIEEQGRLHKMFCAGSYIDAIYNSFGKPLNEQNKVNELIEDGAKRISDEDFNNLLKLGILMCGIKNVALISKIGNKSGTGIIDNIKLLRKNENFDMENIIILTDEQIIANGM